MDGLYSGCMIGTLAVCAYNMDKLIYKTQINNPGFASWLIIYPKIKFI